MKHKPCPKGSSWAPLLFVTCFWHRVAMPANKCRDQKRSGWTKLATQRPLRPYCIFGILIFLIGYKAVTFSHPQLISTLCLAYTAFWSAIAYYDDFAWKPSCANIHQEARQAAQGVGGVEPKPYVFHEVEQSARKQYTVLMSVAVLMAIPMIYAYARVWWVYS